MTNDHLQPADWVTNHADYLYQYAVKRVNDADIARDLVQDTFLAALEKAAAFEGRSSERTWLTAIIKFKIYDVYREKSGSLKELRTEEHEALQQQDFFNDFGHWIPAHYPENFISTEPDPLQAKEFGEVLKRCMEKLPALWLSVFTMKHLDEETTPVICESLRISSSNYWVIVHRAKLSLRACLQKNWI
ncbi:sigma-70 family RNA polymerase sigma factor [Hufsiella ginkgonis]|uniref:Sigma-70 family RNA polymerase sigma factor n=1 Tax=Hufsiella ginkgonis TaxID=2695274 RepID=A0A7K1XYA4_9SPHI|nr:sigma-70 family RNA polymerase sigma factor [Hufsiella ginkgonis]MXV15808.1 sigma-70 family RNA polymerase sigma factor [Hufsiella ginkgonis]